VIRVRSVLVGLILVAAPPVHAAAAGCTVQTIGELPVTMQGLRPVVTATIGGTPVPFMIDSGSFWSIISPAMAQELKLRLEPAPPWLTVRGLGGATETSLAHVRDFRLSRFAPRSMEFIVGGNDLRGGLAGVIGQNLLRNSDVEYDFANGMVRLLRPDTACRQTNLAYWAKGEASSEIPIESTDVRAPHTIGTAWVNGVKMRVMFDSGAASSFLSRSAAERAGVRIEGPNVVPGGAASGIGTRAVQTWIAPFAEFRIGEETIRNTHLRIGDTGLEVDMLLGDDFFLSHRIYVATSQNRLFFTYNGGPVFNLTTTPPKLPAPMPTPVPAAPASADTPALTAAADDAETPADSSAAAAPGEASGALPEVAQGDASGFARRGAAFTARRDYAKALEDYTRAVELDPSQADYFTQRALVRLQFRQPDLARADLDSALKLKPDDLVARLARARLELRGHDTAGALTDLDAAEAAAPREADMRLNLAFLYQSADRLDAALTQFSIWLAAHRTDIRRPVALNGRCWVRALLNQDLNSALDDCNAAVSLAPTAAAYRDSRGLVLLRLGRYAKSAADYDAVLKSAPGRPWSLYGRAIDEQRLGKTAASQADLDAAVERRPGIRDEARKYGIEP
jgi:tetratricopeptide (TPR) repeat protein/predicted aspartyl protease